MAFFLILILEPGYEFDSASLLEYNHMSFGGPPVTVDTVEEADKLLHSDEKESALGNHALQMHRSFFFFPSFWSLLVLILALFFTFDFRRPSFILQDISPRYFVLFDGYILFVIGPSF